MLTTICIEICSPLWGSQADRSRCWSALFVGIPVRSRRASPRGTPSLTCQPFASSLCIHRLEWVIIDKSATEAIRTGDTQVQHNRLEKVVLASKNDGGGLIETYHQLLGYQQLPHTTAGHRVIIRSHSCHSHPNRLLFISLRSHRGCWDLSSIRGLPDHVSGHT